MLAYQRNAPLRCAPINTRLHGKFGHLEVRDIKSLTGLRGYAALWVCAYHYTLTWIGYDNWAMPIARSGDAGVGVFFVLSGFILAYVYKAWFAVQFTRAAYRRFAWYRFARIYPLHMLLLVVVVALMAGGIMPATKNDTPLVFGLNVALLHAWGYPRGVSFNVPSWSISVELLAYLLFPVVLGWVWRASVAALCLTGFTAIAAPHLYGALLSAIGFDVGGMQFGGGLSLLRYVGFFFIGMVTFVLWARLAPMARSLWPFDVAATFGLFGLLAAVYTRAPALIFVAPAFVALMIFGLAQEGALSKALTGNSIAVFLGDISYSLYLSHVALAYVIAAAIPWLGLPEFAKLPLIATVACSIGVATLLYYLVERPARRLLRSWQETVTG